MNGIAALAAKEALVASGLGSSLLPGIAPSAVDGFAAGTLLSGVCFLLVMAPRHGARRNRLSAKAAALIPAAPAPVTAYSGRAGAGTISDPFADESAELVLPTDSPVRDNAVQLPEVKAGAGYRSKHRLADQDAEQRRPDIRRSSGRHAAPSLSLSTRMAGHLPFHQLAVRG
jgi:hypothetical protein